MSGLNNTLLIMDKKRFILDFIKKHELAVIATVSNEGKPEDAVIGFGETSKLELFFGTYKTSRKYKNLKSNPHTAFVIGWEDGQTVQYEGMAEEVTGEVAQPYKDLYFAKNPGAQRYENHPDQTYFKVTPRWIRFSNIQKDPEEVFEIEL